ncbi:hypothetical protein RB653_001433 [Dictyostelium firmibasis]|uniref:Uncharacterized protein n=1 Tax=Dictyostelium firmibasis TaxID=79012 RepID=A0AAN7YVA4_9MYCE
MFSEYCKQPFTIEQFQHSIGCNRIIPTNEEKQSMFNKSDYISKIYRDYDICFMSNRDSFTGLNKLVE